MATKLKAYLYVESTVCGLAIWVTYNRLFKFSKGKLCINITLKYASIDKHLVIIRCCRTDTMIGSVCEFILPHTKLISSSYRNTQPDKTHNRFI